ncbi:hypothetical protein CBS470a_012324 [Colletotrichum nupharicola]|nr:hypothetical protein CBS470a_012324 [Colletotrichum nupharicola]
MGLNYRDHALEANMEISEVPVLFVKPRTALAGPYPAPINVPRFSQDSTSDYEAELSVVLSKSGRDIPESDAMDYVLGFQYATATNHHIIPQREMIFDIPKIIAFLSQGTTLEKGTIIMTGTGPGIGMARDPPIFLKDGDDMRIEISEIGTLVNVVKYE